MNIFILDEDPEKAAEYHCDKHVVKMILESAQMLSTAHWVKHLELNNKSVKDFKKVRDAKNWLANNVLIHKAPPYKLTHYNHPCSVWARKNDKNYLWLTSLLEYLCKEYTKRYKKIHKTAQYINWFKNNLPPNIEISDEISEFAVCMDDEYKVTNNIVYSYRNYYVKAKSKIAKWRYSETPDWFSSDLEVITFKKLNDEFMKYKKNLTDIEIVYRRLGFTSNHRNCIIVDITKSKYDTIFLNFIEGNGNLNRAILQDDYIDVNISVVC